MLSFKEFFFKEQVNPHHMRLSRLTGRIGKMRNGKHEGVNLVADRYKKNDHNFDQNSKQQIGLITPAEADKYFKKYNLNPSERDLLKGVGLGNRDFMIQRINHQYFIKPKKD